MKLIATPLHPWRKRQSDPSPGLQLDQLPLSRRDAGPRGQWDSTPEGQAAKAVYKDQLEFDYQDMVNDHVYYVDTLDGRIWYVPVAQGHGEHLWAETWIVPDEAEMQAERERAQRVADETAAREAKQAIDRQRNQAALDKEKAAADLAKQQADLARQQQQYELDKQRRAQRAEQRRERAEERRRRWEELETLFGDEDEFGFDEDDGYYEDEDDFDDGRRRGGGLFGGLFG